MDYLKLIRDADLVSYAENFNYNLGTYVSEKLFPRSKTQNLLATYKQLIGSGSVPILAEVHAFDTEAKIGDRRGYQEITLQKLLIKEKISLNEVEAQFLMSGARGEDAFVDYVFDDLGNMLSRVLTRGVAMDYDLLSTGSVIVKENGIDKVIDYGFKAENKINFTGWKDPNHDILGDINRAVTFAKGRGRNIVRAITSSQMANLIANNTNIIAMSGGDGANFLTNEEKLKWVGSKFSIEFILEDQVAAKSVKGLENNEFVRLYPENKITFLSTMTPVGKGLFAPTPSELALIKKNFTISERAFCALTQWETPDPAITYSKAEGVYLPVPYDVNGMFIATVLS